MRSDTFLISFTIAQKNPAETGFFCVKPTLRSKGNSNANSAANPWIRDAACLGIHLIA